MPEVGVGFTARHPPHPHWKVATNYDLWSCLRGAGLRARGRAV